MVEFNRAVVDFFVLKGWESAVMIMPENPKDNQGDDSTVNALIEYAFQPYLM